MDLSIVVPVRNMPAHIVGCVRALRSQLIDDDELLVVDDGSNDDTVGNAREAGATVLTNPGPRGPYFARNFGVAQARNDLIVFIDARCRGLPGLIEAHRSLLRQPLNALSCTDVEIVQGRSLASRIAVAQDSWRVDRKVTGQLFDFYPTANLGVRRDAFNAVRGFRAVRSGADADLCWRIQLAGFGRMGVNRDVLMQWIPRDRVRELAEQNYRYGRSSVYLDRLYATVRAQSNIHVPEIPMTSRAPDTRAALGARLMNLPFRAGRVRGRWEHRHVQPDGQLSTWAGLSEGRAGVASDG